MPNRSSSTILRAFTTLPPFRKNIPRTGNHCLQALSLIILAWLQVLSCSSKRVTEPTVFGDTIALTNCVLIDGTGRASVLNATVVIKDSLIVAVGSAGTTAIPRGARVIDLQSATVLPGFINAHVHHGFNRENLEAWANAGVTTVRDLGGPSSFAWKDTVSKDPYCALLVAAGPIMSVPNGYPLVPWGSTHMLPVSSPEEAANEAIQLLDAGADIIKLAIESGAIFQMTIPTLTREEALAAVNAAHQHGTIASAHVLLSGDLAGAVEADVDDIAHMVVDYLPDSLIAVMVDDSVLWIPTLELWHVVPGGQGEAAVSNLRKYIRAGGRVAMGTDFGGYDALFQLGMPIHEMEWMIQAGMSPMQVIVAATRNAAVACNRSADLGTLEPGKIADVLVVNGFPLADIQCLADVRMVIHHGSIIRDAEP